MNTHRLKLSFDDGAMTATVICNGVCEPITACADCGRKIGDGEEERCEVCPEDESEENHCWLKQWAEASDPGTVVEWLRGEVTIMGNGIFDEDEPTIEVFEPTRV